MDWKSTWLRLPAAAALIGWTPVAADLGDLAYVLPNPAPGIADQYGEAAAADGGRLLVGASRDDTPGSFDDAGVAYLYDLASGDLRLTIPNPSDTPEYDAFGAAVDIDGRRLVVGAPFDDGGGIERGAAYVLDGDGALHHTLRSPLPSDGGQFGGAVAVAGSDVLLGEPGACPDGVCSGAAYLFDADTGGLERTYESPNPAPFDRFGAAVAVSDAGVIVGAPGETGGGAVYLFDRVTGDLLRVFRCPAPSDFAQFGAAVAAAGNAILVGAPFGDSASGDAGVGTACLFEADTGDLRAVLASPTPSVSEQFGRSVSLDGGMAVIGAPFDSSPGTTDLAGAAHIFDAATAEFLATLANPSPGFRDAFGYAVTASSGAVVAGAYRSNAGAPKSGSVYVYEGLRRNAPPVVAGARPDRSEIWPPDDRMVDVHILGVSDPEGDPVTLRIDAITQDEPVGGEPDAAGVGASTARLRAERAGRGNGRVYRIAFTASDPLGASAEGTVFVRVPHNRRRPAGDDSDDGQRYDATRVSSTKPALERGAVTLASSPNPFNPATRLDYALTESGPVSLVVYNALGQVVRVLEDGHRASGAHTVRWDGRDDRGRRVSSGLYVARLFASGQAVTHRMLMIK